MAIASVVRASVGSMVAYATRSTAVFSGTVHPASGGRYVVGQVAPGAELRRTFNDLFPALVERTRDEPILLPQAGRAVVVGDEMIPVFKRDAMATARQVGAGAFYGGGKVGAVVWRPSGAAQEVVDRHLEGIARGATLPGRSARQRRRGPAAFCRDGRTWSQLDAPDRGERAAAEPLPNGKVMVLSREFAKWTGYLSDDVRAGQWRVAGTFAA